MPLSPALPVPLSRDFRSPLVSAGCTGHMRTGVPEIGSTPPTPSPSAIFALREVLKQHEGQKDQGFCLTYS